MSISSEIQEQFSFGSQAKGEALWERNSFKLIETYGKSGAAFSVFGGSVYRVELLANPTARTLHVSCTCPHFEDGNACKHIWASLLECDDKGYLANLERYDDLEMESEIAGQFDEDEDYDDLENNIVELPKPQHKAAKYQPVRKVTWQDRLKRVQPRSKSGETPAWARSENPKTASFLLDLRTSLREQEIRLKFLAQEHLKSGKLGVLKPVEISPLSVAQFPDETDRRIIQQLLGRTRLESGYGYYPRSRGWPEVTIPVEHAPELLVEISRAGKLLLADKGFHVYGRSLPKQPAPYSFLEEIWKTVIQLERKDTHYVLSAHLRSPSQKRAAADLIGAVDRLAFFKDFMAPSDLDQTLPWLEQFGQEQLEIPTNEIDSFLEILFRQGHTPELELPDDLKFRQVLDCVPRVRLHFSSNDTAGLVASRLNFVYEGESIDAKSPAAHVYNVREKQILYRNREFENTALQQFASLEPLPANLIHSNKGVHGYFYHDSFIPAAEKALSWNWEVLADQKPVQSPGNFEIGVSSGIDWFELQAELDFDGKKILLPELIAQIQYGSKFVKLDNGALGIVPEQWLQKIQELSKTGQLTKTGVRLSKIQALFLSAEMEGNPNFKADRKFQSLRNLVEDLRKLKPKEAPKIFKGTLRAYQKQGLSWLTLVSDNGVGGILADDMGLGKTVQVLALLAGIKADAPHLVVAPKSLIFNWMQESKRFTPHLRLLDFTGTKRSAQFGDYDIVFTTYQTLRSDIERLSRHSFASLILDEAHYVKNPKSQSAMACRLIRSPKKIALTGTPVENSLGDLFSILNIVNPGLLNDSQIRAWSQEKDPTALSRLALGLRPFLLRRTKEAVLKDLPPKSEQILYCELSAPERKRYNDLRTFYWTQLSGKVEAKGLARSKIEVLEALLRLRQASCHQGLLDAELRGKSSAKFDLLLDQIESVIQDGRKALIFSQFTSLLSLLQEQLQQRGLAYEYLDGKTNDRQERVERFQSDPDIKLFLLSLKAGGVGLNLTAADYVFILDPWWNPAAESQAIDRTHRIGQTKQVFAYKIIAKDTVEEKILELQKTKKALAQAIISDEQSVLKNLTMTDLQALFS